MPRSKYERRIQYRRAKWAYRPTRMAQLDYTKFYPIAGFRNIEEIRAFLARRREEHDTGAIPSSIG